MEFIKTAFTIKDLENISGIKRHSIRSWERRYNLLSPERTESNIRYYSTSSLMHLLNITLLCDNGYKISNIAKLNKLEISAHCKNLVEAQAEKNQFINKMKIAMLNFDKQLFEETFQNLQQDLPFQQIFRDYIFPFLNEVGLLWHTDTLNPAHEHFISSLIKQKVLIRTEKLIPSEPKHSQYKFVLFLPDNEIHDLGITYLNYEILNKGFQTIFLGQSVPISCLDSFKPSGDAKLIFISYFTVKPEASKVLAYLEEIHATILSAYDSQFWVSGYQVQQIPTDNLPKSIKIFSSSPELLDTIDVLEGQ